MKEGLWLIIWTGLIVAGCGRMVKIEADPDNRYYMPPVGATVKIHEELTVRGGWARVFLQRGETVSYGDFDRYHPSCDFALERVDAQPQLIKPGSFTIIDVRRRTEEVASYRPVRYASRQLLAFGGGGSGGQYMVMRTVRMQLESEEQPGVQKLICRGALDDPPNAREVSISEMREALGVKATIVLPEEQ